MNETNPEDELGQLEAELRPLFERARPHPPDGERLAAWLAAPQPAARHAARSFRRWLVVSGAAAAAVLACAVWVVLSLSARPAFALTHVAEAMRNARIVKITGDDGSVFWECRGQFSGALRKSSGAAWFRNYPEETVATYEPARAAIILSSADFKAPAGLFGANTLAEMVKQAEDLGRCFRYERVDYEENGRSVIEIRPRGPNNGPDDAIIIDATSGLMVEARGASGRTRVEYPDHGINDIFELGVPRDTPVFDFRVPREIWELRERVQAARPQSFGAYRLVRVSSLGGFLPMRMITDGTRTRTELYPFDDTRDYTVEELTSMARGLDDMERRDAALDQLYMCDGERETSFYLSGTGTPRTKRTEACASGNMQHHSLEGICGLHGPFLQSLGDARFELLESNERGWAGVRQLEQANHPLRPRYAEIWYDPAHMYLKVFSAGGEFPDAVWQIDPGWREQSAKYGSSLGAGDPDAPATWSEEEVLEWGETRPGEYYPALIARRSYQYAVEGFWEPRLVPNCPNCRPFSYDVIIATPLQDLDASWFEIPAEWDAMPANCVE